MASIARFGRRLWPRNPSPPRSFHNSGFRVLDTAQRIEEENYAWYKPSQFYSVRIGEVFKARYQVIGKLGYGAYSTVWLCRDLQSHNYVALKVCERNSPQVKREVEVYKFLNTMTTSHTGSTLIRTALDSFEISSSEGSYQCLVHKPLGMSLSRLRLHCPAQKFPALLLKPTLIHILLALDFLHTEAHVIHTDLHPKNILLSVEDDSILANFEDTEKKEPSPRKIDGERVIHTSRELSIPAHPGRPVLCDFGQARFGEQFYDDDVQPYLYRAPEVILEIPWNHKIDIWNVGVMTWDLFQNKHMFNAKDAKNEDSSLYHLAEMIALLGLPPKHFIQRSKVMSVYFDEQGKWKGKVEIPAISLEESEDNLEGKDKTLFLQFMRKMLRWVPEERGSAKELLQDPWLKRGAKIT